MLCLNILFEMLVDFLYPMWLVVEHYLVLLCENYLRFGEFDTCSRIDDVLFWSGPEWRFFFKAFPLIMCWLLMYYLLTLIILQVLCNRRIYHLSEMCGFILPVIVMTNEGDVAFCFIVSKPDGNAAHQVFFFSDFRVTRLLCFIFNTDMENLQGDEDEQASRSVISIMLFGFAWIVVFIRLVLLFLPYYVTLG